MPPQEYSNQLIVIQLKDHRIVEMVISKPINVKNVMITIGSMGMDVVINVTYKFVEIAFTNLTPRFHNSVIMEI